MNYLFTCGGTAGHINPALAVAGRIAELMPEAGILFVGAEGQMESRLVPEAGFDLKTIRITNFQRSMRPDKVLHNLRTIKNVFTSSAEAARILKSFKPNAALGTGGYVCYPVLSAAKRLDIPAFLHESNAVPGLTTRMLSKRVNKLLLGYENGLGSFSNRSVFTGTPVRGGFTQISIHSAKKALKMDPNRPLVVSVWGSLGSDHMNRLMKEFIAATAAEQSFSLIHSTGERGYERLMSSVNNPGELKRKGVDIRGYINNMPEVMAAADLVLCRAGASTLSELAVAGKPAILVPSPNVTNNHQEKNARVIERAGAAVVLLESEFSGMSLYAEVSRLLSEESTLRAMAENMRSLAVPDACDRIVDILLAATV